MVMEDEAILELAKDKFASGYNCAQAAALAIAEGYELDTGGLAEAMQPFGAGMSTCGGTCGAVTGVLAGIGLVFGNPDPDDADGKQKCYSIAALYMGMFRERRKTTNCTDLTGYDLGDPGQKAEATESGVFIEVCPKIVEDSIRVFLEVAKMASGGDD